MVTTAEHGTIRIEMSDGKNVGFWACDRGVIKPKTRHHVAIIVDGGPNVISFVVDGILCDGGTASIYGWGRFGPELGDVSGSGRAPHRPVARRSAGATAGLPSLPSHVRSRRQLSRGRLSCKLSDGKSLQPVIRNSSFSGVNVAPPLQVGI